MTTAFDPLLFDSAPEDFPLAERLGIRDGIATFESQFRTGFPTLLMTVIANLKAIPFRNCYGGAADFPINPLIVELGSNSFNTGRDVLTALQANRFSSEHIRPLHLKSIPYPGYQPGTENDEVHDDESGQHIFARPADGDDEEFAAPSRAVLRRLRDHVMERHLWFVLLHFQRKPYMGFMFAHYVLLCAVGRALTSGYAIGAVTQQLCHNYCD